MSALEEIQRAIEKLTELRDAATPGPWFPTYESSTHPRIWGNADEDDADHVATMARSVYDGELIVTLHRTIDAQIALLSHTVNIHARFEVETEWLRAVERAGDLALARAITGTSA